MEQPSQSTVWAKQSPDNGWCMHISLNKINIFTVKKEMKLRQDAKTRNAKNCWQSRKAPIPQ